MIEIVEEKLAINTTTTKLLLAIYEQLQDINKKLDLFFPKQEIKKEEFKEVKPQVKKGAKK